MPGVRVDGNDPLAMYDAAKTAIDRARAGDGPTLIEAMTFRFYGHVFGDADAYMDKEEKKTAMANDPVPRFRQWLIDNSHATDSDLAALETTIGKEIDDAIAAALAAPFPDASELRKDVFADEIPA